MRGSVSSAHFKLGEVSQLSYMSFADVIVIAY